MYRTKLAVLIVIGLIWGAFHAIDAGAHHEEIIIGAGPTYFDAVVAGAALWNETGVVTIGVQRDCRAGEIHVCWGNPAKMEGDWIAAWYEGTSTISVFQSELFTPAVACHEIGHALGMVKYYEDGSPWHRTEGNSCMVSDGTEYEYALDAYDVEWIHNHRHGDGTGV